MIADKASFNTSMNRGGMFLMFFAFALFHAQAMAAEHDSCHIGGSSPKELSYEECVNELVVEVSAPMVCNIIPVGGSAKGKKVLRKNGNEDFPSSVPVHIYGVCDNGHVHTATVGVALIKKRSGKHKGQSLLT